MDSITLISSTNREDAVTRIVTDIYTDIYKKLGVTTRVIDLQLLPEDFIFSALYNNAGMNPSFNEVREIMAASKKFVFLVPEYNGSFPGVLKAFIDGLKFPETFTNKKCALVGISSGIQGGGLAVSHLTDIFNYCGMHVLALKVKLARIELHLKEGKITNELYQELLEIQAKQLLEF